MHSELPALFEVGSYVVLGLVLLADLLLVVKRPHIPSMKESTVWVVFYVVLALVFGMVLFLVAGADFAGQFIAGWLTEYSLSIDNLFVFVLIMTKFAVPKKNQQEVLMVGIIIALVFRGLFILVGATVIEHFSAVFYIFGVFLLWTAWRQAFGEDESAEDESAMTRFLRRRMKVSPDFDGTRLRTMVDGRRMWTPMVMVFIVIGFTDVMFAIDSIPAIFGITQSAFIVFTANVFALMGLRQLYFMLGGLLEKLEYLKYGIAFILAFIGAKLVLHALHENEVPFINGGEPVLWAPEIGTAVSLVVIVVSMLVATVASLIAARRRGARDSDTGGE